MSEPAGPGPRRPRTAIVLSGGGARGAYEAGVLSAVADRAALRPGPITDVVCGTSVGAITGALLAAMIDEPRAASEHLWSIWCSLTLEQVLSFGGRQVVAIPRVLFGGERAVGLFDGRALARVVERNIAWGRISDHIAAGRLAALTVTATHLPTGRPIVFVQRRPDVPKPERAGRRVVVEDAVIGLNHVLASAAIPIVFPPVRVGTDLYCDGGLRLNTPLGPAIRLGVRKVLAVGLSTAHQDVELASKSYPSASFLLGKVLNAFLLDHVMSDLDELYRINRMLGDGETVCGPDFADRMSGLARQRGAPEYHRVDAFVVRPSENLAILAAQHLRRMKRRVGRVSAARALLRVLDTRETPGSDLASYLLFDRDFAQELIQLGRRDALACRDQLDAFLAP